MTASPSYLWQSLELGFDSDDITALIVDIDASQSEHGQPLPCLPAEIMFMILEYISIDHVLDYRLVCKGFRDHIDKRVLYSYICRTELLGSVISPSNTNQNTVFIDSLHQLQWIKAKFSHLENLDGTRKSSGSIWSQAFAVFSLDNGWFKAFAETKSPNHAVQSFPTLLLEDPRPSFASLENRTPGAFNELGWLVCLDQSVMEVDLGKQSSETRSMWLDVEKRRVVVEWRVMLMNLLRSETNLRKTMEKTRDGSAFTFSHPEDCLRSVRRNRARSVLDMNSLADRMLSWSLRSLRPLFGKNCARIVPAKQLDLNTAEDSAVLWLLRWRRAASWSQSQGVYLKQLALDRKTLMKELGALNKVFGTWKSNMYDPSTESGSYSKVVSQDTKTRPFIKLPSNPLFWTLEEIANEDQRVRKWKSQKKMVESMMTLLEESNEVLNIPEDAFDDELDSDV